MLILHGDGIVLTADGEHLSALRDLIFLLKIPAERREREHCAILGRTNQETQLK